MTIQSYWYDQKCTILITDYGEIWTWDDLNNHNATTIPMLKSATQPVISISDFSRTIWHNHGLFYDNAMKAVKRHRGVPVTMSIFVLKNKTIEIALETIFKQHGTAHRHYAFSPTLHQALEYAGIIETADLGG